MKNNKNIDRLFQERFKDFETEPNKNTWAKIQVGLKEEKKERKILPFWLKITGIAAAFIIGFFGLNTVFNTNSDLEKSIVIETKSLNSATKNKDSVPAQIKENQNRIDIKNNSEIAVTDHHKTNRDENQTTTPKQTKNVFGKTPNHKTAAVYIRKNNQSLEKAADKKETSKTDSFLVDQKILKTTNPSDNIVNHKNEKENLAIAKTNSNTEILIQNTVSNELEAILKKNEEQKNKPATVAKSKWEIAPSLVAMYANSKGASIDPQFNQNTKSTDKSLGFGIGVHYALSKKIALRTGINKFELGYNTNNVTYSTGLSNTYLANVAYTTNPLIEVRSNSSVNSLMTFEKNLQNTNTGTINQKMGYYEVPLEVSYTVLDQKISINLIGGISTLFLDENKISLISSKTNLKLGEANNLNAMHFSGNIGLGFKYKFVKSFQINFEPMAKYQLNTFSNNSGSNKPVLIGLYSGISYHF